MRALVEVEAERRRRVREREAEAVARIWRPLPGPQTLAYESPADELFYGGAAGGGKALGLETPLPTPSGWTTMGEVRPGDRLFDEAGQPCTVTATSAVMLEHDVYEVVFDDGSSILADAEHRWFTTTALEREAIRRRSDGFRARRRLARVSRSTGKRPDLATRNRLSPTATLEPPPPGGIRTTLEILETLRVGRSGRANHAVPVAAPLELPDADLPIPPYVLGVWLGDGASRAGRVYVHDSDLETIHNLEIEGYPAHRVPSEPIGWTVGGLQNRLRAAGLLENKHVPPAYLRSGRRQRLELLMGLMDTDGTAAKSGACEFTSTNRRLADGVLELLSSLGLKCRLRVGRATLRGKDCGEKYVLKFTTDTRVFRLERKAARQVSRTRGVQCVRYIVDVRPVSSIPVKCVAVDSPSRLYLAGRAMIPTHNSDLLLGLALTAHRDSIVFRREFVHLKALVKRSREIVCQQGRFNGQDLTWRDLPGGRMLEFGAVQFEDDREDYQGRPHDLKAFDELPHFSQSQFRYLIAWNRTTVPGQRCRVVAAGNPPTPSQGQWVVEEWAPWLDLEFPDPAEPGELRWYAMLDDRLTWVAGPEPFEHEDKSGRVEIVYPKSRTFIPARVDDNPYLIATGYKATLQNMPEPLRSQLLYGDFNAGTDADPWQVIPTEWARAAQRRWRDWSPDGLPPPGATMSRAGMDVAHGGKDKTVVAPRYVLPEPRRLWFAPLTKVPGAETPDGKSAAQVCVNAIERDTRVNVDAIGYGASAAEKLADHPSDGGYGLDATAVNVAEASEFTDRSGKFRMRNKRAEMYWRLREALDPEGDWEVALPPDQELLADLCSAKYEITPGGIKIEAKDEIIERLNRSPDAGDAVALAMLPGRPVSGMPGSGGPMVPRDTITRPSLPTLAVPAPRAMPVASPSPQPSPARVGRMPGTGGPGRPGGGPSPFGPRRG